MAQRETVWLGGIQTTTSRGWNNNLLRYLDQTRGYDFVNLLDTNTDPEAVYNPGEGLNAATQQVLHLVEGKENVLGVAHDFGGLVLRQSASQTTAFTGMILTGVPNRGSSAIELATDTNLPGGTSTIQNIINAVQDVKSGDECEDCRLVEQFESWIDEIAGNVTLYSQMEHASVEVNALNQNLPTIPVAQLWGSVKELSITNIMDSRASINGFSDLYTECYTETIARTRREAKEDGQIALLDATSNFFTTAINSVVSVAAQPATPDPVQVVSAITKFVSSTLNLIETKFTEQTELDRELARILRCETANQYLAVEWELALMEYGSVEVNELLIPDVNYCYTRCIEAGAIDFTALDDCVEECLEQDSTPELVAVTIFTTEPNDGLLTRSEQLLPGTDENSPFVYHLSKVNHLQESLYNPENPGPGSTQHVLDELFEGSASPAFAVPID